MTAQVIPFPVKPPIVEEEHFQGSSIAGTPVPKPTCKFEYLDLCKKFLDPQDYQDILCGIMDREHYDALDQYQQNIIDCYYEFRN